MQGTLIKSDLLNKNSSEQGKNRQQSRLKKFN